LWRFLTLSGGHTTDNLDATCVACNVHLMKIGIPRVSYLCRESTATAVRIAFKIDIDVKLRLLYIFMIPTHAPEDSLLTGDVLPASAVTAAVDAAACAVLLIMWPPVHAALPLPPWASCGKQQQS